MLFDSGSTIASTAVATHGVRVVEVSLPRRPPQRPSSCAPRSGGLVAVRVIAGVTVVEKLDDGDGVDNGVGVREIEAADAVRGKWGPLSLFPVEPRMRK